jgi:hypothetical protein
MQDLNLTMEAARYSETLVPTNLRRVIPHRMEIFRRKFYYDWSRVTYVSSTSNERRQMYISFDFLLVAVMTQMLSHPTHVNTEDGGSMLIRNVGIQRYLFTTQNSDYIILHYIIL